MATKIGQKLSKVALISALSKKSMIFFLMNSKVCGVDEFKCAI